MKRWAIAGVVLVALFGAVYCFDPTGVVPGTLRGEPFFEGRPASFWARAIASDDPRTQLQAHDRLKGNAAAVPVLTRLLDPAHAGPEVRWRAADYLPKVDAALAAPPLTAALKDPDPQVRAVVRERFADLYRFVAKATGADTPAVRQFFATGMLMNVAAAMDLSKVRADWAQGCMGGPL